jgi:hypothetical protein
MACITILWNMDNKLRRKKNSVFVKAYHKLLWHGRSGARSLSILESRDCRLNTRKWGQLHAIQLSGLLKLYPSNRYYDTDATKSYTIKIKT